MRRVTKLTGISGIHIVVTVANTIDKTISRDQSVSDDTARFDTTIECTNKAIVDIDENTCTGSINTLIVLCAIQTVVTSTKDILSVAHSTNGGITKGGNALIVRWGTSGCYSSATMTLIIASATL
jgi:hypothetical protein